jgi:menaquinone-dependent protoporphyrinogen oxidase
MATRRGALRRLGLCVAAFTALGGVFIAWATRRPEIALAQGRCAGGDAVNKKVLVAYATRAGSTGEVARVISERLCARGFDAEVKPIAAVQDVAGYDALVLGSAVRYGGWLPEMTKFIETQRAALAALPVAIFTMHMQALDDSPASGEKRAGYTQAVRQLISPREQAYFAGKLDSATLSFFERMAVKLVKSPIGDQRDWERIRSWADGLAGKF